MQTSRSDNNIHLLGAPLSNWKSTNSNGKDSNNDKVGCLQLLGKPINADLHDNELAAWSSSSSILENRIGISEFYYFYLFFTHLATPLVWD
jgi:hypothetical protein